jgi:hypothetical protein
MHSSADLFLFRAEDALAFLGLLSSLYLRFDPPISSAGDTRAVSGHAAAPPSSVMNWAGSQARVQAESHRRLNTSP